MRFVQHNAAGNEPAYRAAAGGGLAGGLMWAAAYVIDERKPEISLRKETESPTQTIRLSLDFDDEKRQDQRI